MSMRSTPKPRLWPYLTPPALLLLLVLTGPAFYGLSAASSGSPEASPDANIGTGLAMIWTAVCGLPWSVWPWMSGGVETMSSHVKELIFTVCALINVGLLAAFTLWLRRRAQPHDR